MFQIKQSNSHPNNMWGRKETFLARMHVRSKGKTSKTRFLSILTLFGVGRRDQGQPPVCSWFHIKINTVSNSKEFCLNHPAPAHKAPSRVAVSPFSLGGGASCLCPSLAAALGTHTCPFCSYFCTQSSSAASPNCLQSCQLVTLWEQQLASIHLPHSLHVTELLRSNLSGGNYPHLNRPELSCPHSTCVWHLRGKLGLSHNLSFLKLLWGKIIWA